MLTRGLHTGQLPTSHGIKTVRPRPDRISPCKSRRGSAFSGGFGDDNEVMLDSIRKGLNELPKTLAAFGDRTEGATWRQKISDWEQTLENMEKAHNGDASPRSRMAREWMPEGREKARTSDAPPGSRARTWRQAGSDQDRAMYEVAVAVDVEEYPESYALWLDVPGLQKSDVKIQVSPSMRTMTISGERKRDGSAEPTGRVRHERKMGKFSRTVRLAKDLDASTITAKVDRGVLHVTARKVPVVEPEDDCLEIPIQ